MMTKNCKFLFPSFDPGKDHQIDKAPAFLLPPPECGAGEIFSSVFFFLSGYNVNAGEGADASCMHIFSAKSWQNISVDQISVHVLKLLM